MSKAKEAETNGRKRADGPPDELLILSRLERMLAKLPDEAARERVLAYLTARHRARQVGPLKCNAVPMAPAPELFDAKS